MTALPMSREQLEAVVYDRPRPPDWHEVRCARTAIAYLEAKERAERERDTRLTPEQLDGTLEHLRGTCAAADARADRAEAEAGALRAALEKYGKHPDWCQKGVGVGVYKPPINARCDCGIDAALDRSEQPEAQREEARIEIVDLENELGGQRAIYLRACGWENTSSTPHCGWMWQREIKGAIYSVSEGDAMRIQEALDG
jgi:hypothetical protein